MRKYDVFLSYRRDGGEDMALLLRDRLSARGYRVFLDIESLNSGSFNTQLLQVIDNCADFVLIASKGCLERCVNDGDWVRLEIARALKGDKNIIPVMLRGFEFPEVLPDDINAIRLQNGISAKEHEYFDAVVERLDEKFLKSKPATARTVPQPPAPRQSAYPVNVAAAKKNTSNGKTAIVVGSCFSAVGLATFAWNSYYWVNDFDYAFLRAIPLALGIMSIIFGAVNNKKSKSGVMKIEVPKATGNLDHDNMITGLFENREALAKIHNTIVSVKIREPLSEILSTLDEIGRYITKYPDRIGRLRQFAAYYLPTTVNLLNTYVELEATRGKGENIKTTLEQIENIMNSMVSVFKQEHDSLFSDSVMDVSAEITVMQNIIDGGL